MPRLPDETLALMGAAAAAPASRRLREPTPKSGGYSSATDPYADLGWETVPVDGKVIRVKGATGRQGTVTDDKRHEWASDPRHQDANIAIRHNGTIAIDVDEHDDKHGAATLAAFEAEFGPRTPTWTSTARHATSPESRQYHYRIEPGTVLISSAENVEFCQFHRRYSVVAPSIHPVTGEPYLWFDPDGNRSDRPPHVEELPFLDAAWVDGLRVDRGAQREAATPGGNSTGGVFKGMSLPDLRKHAPQRHEGRTNDWLTVVAGHHAKRHRKDADAFRAACRKDFQKVDPAYIDLTVDPDYEDFNKALESVWDSEHENHPERENGEDDTPLEVIYAQVLAEQFEFFKTSNRRPFALPKSGVRRPVFLSPSGQGGLRNTFALALLSRGLRPAWSVIESVLAIRYLLTSEEAPTLEPHLRAVQTDEGVVLDLGRSEDTACVVITADGWKVRDEPPEGVVFRLSGATRPLPVPVKPEDPEALAYILGFERDDRRWLLVRGWLACALLANVPRPVLFLYGRQGTAKTTKGQMLVNVFDPRDHLGSSFGQNADSEIAMAMARYLVAWDNVAAVSQEVSDRLCRFVTGATEDQREFYTNADLVTFEYMRTGVITGLSVPGFRPDALDRLIQVEADRITGRERKTERQVWADYWKVHPQLLGAALDDLATVLRRLPDAQTQDMDRPRMADYGEALWALGPEYLDAFTAAHEAVLVDAAESDPFTASIVAWLEDALATDPELWVSSAEVYEGVKRAAGFTELRDTQLPHWWPKSVRAFSGQLTKNAEPLRAVGFDFDHKARSRSARGIRFWRVGATFVEPLPGTEKVGS